MPMDTPLTLVGSCAVALGDKVGGCWGGDVAYLEDSLEHGEGEDQGLTLHSEYLHLWIYQEAAVCRENTAQNLNYSD